MLSRFIQAIGGSVGSVLAQAVCRDAFQGAALGKVYATVGSSLSVFPAFSPKAFAHSLQSLFIIEDL